MAGAVSAGAYTAGVVDFLMEALETWERKKRRGDTDAPSHAVRLDVVTGASAGSIAAAVFVSALRDKNYPDIRPPAERRPTPLYEAWVKQVDIKPLLALDDLEKTAAKDGRGAFRRFFSCLSGGKDGPAKPGAIRSVLNSDALDRIANNVLDVQWTRESWPSYLADPLKLYFTVTNLRGVPYAIQFTGQAGNIFGMSQHADNMSFCLNADGQPGPKTDLMLGAIGQDNGLAGNWHILGQSALASGAFPVGLAARLLERRGTAAYDERLWPVPLSPAAVDADGACVCASLETIAPAWPDGIAPDYLYQFENVDGGVANNEPFELARRYLAGGLDHLPRGAKDADATVLMVDPFPNDVSFDTDYRPDTGLANVLKKLVGAMVNQLRFKTEELELVKHGGIHSRWIVAPKRSGGHPPLASASLGAFGGFLSEAFRQHDYQLGRRNCQRFLSETLLLHEDNPVFAGHWPASAASHFRKDRSAADGKAEDEQGVYLPVIPLFDACAVEVPEPVWPLNALNDFSELTRLIKARVDLLRERLIDTSVNECVDRALLKLGWQAIELRRRAMGQQSLIVSGIMDAIQADLRRCKLLD